MPLPQRKLFRCKKCGYSKTYTISDSMGARDLMKTCPKCGAKMYITGGKPENIFDKIFEAFKE